MVDRVATVAFVFATSACSFEYSVDDQGIPLDGGSDGTSGDTVALDSRADVDAAEASDGEVSDGLTVSCDALGGTVHAGHCYWIITTSMSQPKAREACKTTDFSAHLVTISDAAENKFVWDLATSLPRWIGLHAPAPSTNKADYQWITGEPKPFENWTSTEPAATGACVRMNPINGQWGDRKCDDAYSVTCERDSP